MLCLACSTAFAQFTFTEKESTPFTGVNFSSIAFADVNKDGHPDVLITGWLGGSERIAKLYLNDGSGNFTEKTEGASFAGVNFSSIAFADVDKDGDQDVLITGSTGSEGTSKLYLNNGSGGFTEKESTPFTGVGESSIAFADVDKNGYEDVLITGADGSLLSSSNLYLNDGEGGFTSETTSFTRVKNGSIAFADVNGDGHQDVLITGEGFFSTRAASLYLNNGSGGFTLKAAPFTGVSLSSIAFADVNKDGHQDVLITGETDTGRIANLYLNDGSGNFTEKTEGASFAEVSGSSIAFADVDKDGDPDVLITGYDGAKNVANLYLNDGEGNFMEKSGTPFAEVAPSSIAFADVDKDGDQDVLITGQNNDLERIAKLYINDQAPVFSSESSASVPENTTAVLTVSADDDSETLTYSVSGGADRSLFSINRNSGALTFNTAPDFEAMSSDAGNNIYVVEVTASDGVNDVTQTITVTVDDVNEAPAFDTPSGTTWFYVEENAEDANV
ncbi:MAG: VCBS repeat-containing protein, partial [Ekhidna sp.]|nr:VCBS repeat-containing protein [Ekhidna sp.]